MMKLNDIEGLFNIGSAQSLCTNLRKICEKHPDKLLFFRGHSRDDYEIKPSIYRSEDRLKKEDKYYKELLCICPQEFSSCSTTFERLVKMQHYGLPTRLLDITSNPLVAAYFASKDFDYDGSMLIFILDKNDVAYFDSSEVCAISNLSQLPYNADLNNDKDLLLSKIRGDAYNVFYTGAKMVDTVLCVKAKPNNSRIIRQSGSFFLFGMSDKKLIDTMSQSKYSYYEIKVLKDRKRKLLEDLDDLGVNQSSLFPEIDKVSEYLIQHL